MGSRRRRRSTLALLTSNPRKRDASPPSAPLSHDQLHELFDAVEHEPPPPPGADVPADAWLKSKGATPLQLEVAEVCYANDFGCGLADLGLREMIVESKRCGVW